MNNIIIKNILRFILLITIQVLILNNILFIGYINPYIYLLFILLLPFNTPRWLILSLGFILGISIDAFQNSIGLHAFACVLIAFLRQPILNFLLPELKNKSQTYSEFSVQEFGLQRTILYTTSMVLIHHFTLFTLEALNMEIFNTILRSLISSFFTIVLIIIIQYLLFKEIKR